MMYAFEGCFSSYRRPSIRIGVMLAANVFLCAVIDVAVNVLTAKVVVGVNDRRCSHGVGLCCHKSRFNTAR